MWQGIHADVRMSGGVAGFTCRLEDVRAGVRGCGRLYMPTDECQGAVDPINYIHQGCIIT